MNQANTHGFQKIKINKKTTTNYDENQSKKTSNNQINTFALKFLKPNIRNYRRQLICDCWNCVCLSLLQVWLFLRSFFFWISAQLEHSMSSSRSQNHRVKLQREKSWKIVVIIRLPWSHVKLRFYASTTNFLHAHALNSSKYWYEIQFISRIDVGAQWFFFLFYHYHNDQKRQKKLWPVGTQ